MTTVRRERFGSCSITPETALRHSLTAMVFTTGAAENGTIVGIGLAI